MFNKVSVKTQDVSNVPHPGVHVNMPSGDCDSGTESKVC